LSSRLIPHAQIIITTLLSAAQSATAVSSQAFITISAVIEAIPSFIGAKQLSSILRASIEQRAENDVSTKLLTVTARKIPTKTLFPVIMDLWKDIQNADASVSCFSFLKAQADV
jgi:U3 small nucleolar RNA-associated protein 10